jgi:hypothetical protein
MCGVGPDIGLGRRVFSRLPLGLRFGFLRNGLLHLGFLECKGGREQGFRVATSEEQHHSKMANSMPRSGDREGEREREARLVF